MWLRGSELVKTKIFPTSFCCDHIYKRNHENNVPPGYHNNGLSPKSDTVVIMARAHCLQDYI